MKLTSRVVVSSVFCFFSFAFIVNGADQARTVSVEIQPDASNEMLAGNMIGTLVESDVDSAGDSQNAGNGAQRRAKKEGDDDTPSSEISGSTLKPTGAPTAGNEEQILYVDGSDSEKPANSTVSDQSERMSFSPQLPTIQTDQDEADYLIMNGNTAPLGAYPYFVDLDGCGATLIHPNIVLSAAHCNTDPNTGSYTTSPLFVDKFVRVGAYLATAAGAADGSQLVRVVGQILHPRVVVPDPTKNLIIANDFMILILEREITINSNIELRLSRNEEDIEPDTPLITIGLGATLPQHSAPAVVLQETTLFALGDKVCGLDFPDANVCASSPFYDSVFTSPPRSSCQGDSGGPLLRADGNIHYQVGVTSFGANNCQTNSPSVWSQIPGYEDGFGWIHQTVCGDLGLNATFCGGNECESDCDCNLGYECGCLDDSSSSSSSSSSSDDGERFLSSYEKHSVVANEDYAKEFESIAKPSRNAGNAKRKQGRRRKLQSSSSGKGSKGCKSVKGCKGGKKGGVDPICLDNGELSGDSQDEVNALFA